MWPAKTLPCFIGYQRLQLGEEKVNNEPCYKINASLVNGLVKII